MRTVIETPTFENQADKKTIKDNIQASDIQKAV
jgi:hypothetical protein